MKKFLLSLIALLGVVSANAQELSIADVEIVPGAQATFAIVLKNETSVRFRDSEFHFTFPAGISPVSAASGDQNIEPGTNLVGDDYRVTIAAMSDAQSQGIEGNFTVCYITIGAEAGLAEGTYTATLAKAEMTGNGELIPGTSNYEIVKKNFENITFNIIVSNTVTLDENSTSVPVAVENVSVLVKRSIKANQWSTICLPFAIDDPVAVFGEGVELADFTDYEETYDETDENVISIAVHFSTVTSMEANHPYIIKVTNPVTYEDGFKVEDATLEPSQEEAIVEYDNGLTGKRRVVYGTFYGTYVAETVVPENSLFISNNKFFYSTGATKMKAFRGYFDFMDEIANKVVASTVKMQFDVDGTTKIDDLHLVDTVGAVYTVDGKFIGRDVNLKKLQKGIYVIDGKKVAIK